MRSPVASAGDAVSAIRPRMLCESRHREELARHERRECRQVSRPRRSPTCCAFPAAPRACGRDRNPARPRPGFPRRAAHREFRLRRRSARRDDGELIAGRSRQMVPRLGELDRACEIRRFRSNPGGCRSFRTRSAARVAPAVEQRGECERGTGGRSPPGSRVVRSFASRTAPLESSRYARADVVPQSIAIKAQRRHRSRRPTVDDALRPGQAVTRGLSRRLPARRRVVVRRRAPRPNARRPREVFLLLPQRRLGLQ
jgi:hypothetical protein